jgi:hypothetical protein
MQDKQLFCKPLANFAKRQFVPGSASRVPAGRKTLDFTAETNPLPCATSLSTRARSIATCLSPQKPKEQTHGTRKTRHKTPGTAQEVPKKAFSSQKASCTNPRRKRQIAQIATHSAIAAPRSASTAVCGFSASVQPPA